MPEFTLETPDTLDDFTRAYIEALFFTEEEQLCEEMEGRELPAVAINTETMESSFVGGNSVGFDDLAPETLQTIIDDCAAFQAAHGEQIDLCPNYDREQAGHDFWLTRNRHGAGFWDRGLCEIGTRFTDASHDAGETYAYVGDNGKVYLG